MPSGWDAFLPLPKGYRVREGIQRDAILLGPHLKESDQRELRAAQNRDPQLILREAIKESDQAFTLLKGDTVIGLFGVRGVSSNLGIPWFLSSSEINRIPKGITRLAIYFLDRFNDHYQILSNFCDARNHQTIKWLEFCGCSFIGCIEEYGAQKRPFQHFIRERKDHV